MQGFRLLANVSVAKEVARLQKAVAEKAEVRAADVLLELKEIAFHEVAKITGTEKLAALDKLCRHLGLYNNDKGDSGDNTIKNYGPTLILAGPREQYVGDGAERQAD